MRVEAEAKKCYGVKSLNSSRTYVAAMKQQVNKRCIEEISVDPCKSHLAQFDLRNCFECLTSHKHLKWKSSEFVEVDKGKRVNLIGISVKKKGQAKFVLQEGESHWVCGYS